MTSKTTAYSFSSSSKSSSGGGAALGSYSYPEDKDSSQVVIKSSDMTENMQEDAIRVTEDAFEHNKVEKDIAAHIKKKFDEKHGTAWHCIVGRNFGSYVTHETKNFIYLYKKQVAVLLFKSG